jgi:hypothetical protein
MKGQPGNSGFPGLKMNTPQFTFPQLFNPTNPQGPRQQVQQPGPQQQFQLLMQQKQFVQQQLLPQMLLQHQLMPQQIVPQQMLQQQFLPQQLVQQQLMQQQLGQQPLAQQIGQLPLAQQQLLQQFIQQQQLAQQQLMQAQLAQQQQLLWKQLAKQGVGKGITPPSGDAISPTELAANALSPDLSKRQAAAESLGRLGAAAKPAVSVLMNALKSDDETLQLRAVRALTAIGSDAEEATGALVALLGNSKLRPDVVKALGNIGRAAVPYLLQAMDSNDRFVRLGASRALGAIGPAAMPAVSVLTTSARTDTSLSVREAAQEALKKINW